MSTSLAIVEPAPLQAPLSFAVPLADAGDFALIPQARRHEINQTLVLLKHLHSVKDAMGLVAASKAIAATAGKGYSGPSLRRKYYAYLEKGWRALVKEYRGPSSTPPEFIEFVRKLAEENNRSMKAAWRYLREEIWARGHAVPGYGTWQEYHAKVYPERPIPAVFPRSLIPPGWSERSCYRKAPSKGARKLYQQGLAAAKKHFPSVKRDPSGLRPLELIVVDDFELDHLCVFRGDSERPPQIAPVAGLLAKCVGTRKNLAWCLGARLEREEAAADGSVRKIRTGIDRVSVQYLIYEIFEKYGLPNYPITLLVENATAAISPEFELALQTLFDGRVRVERTGLIEHKTLTNGFVERGGKPWEKGWIESEFNYLWNAMGSVPGYKGSNQRLNGPGDLDEKLRYTRLLIGQGARALNLPSDKLAVLKLPFPSLEDLQAAFAFACARSEARTNHKFIGFDRVTEFLLAEGTEPQPFAALAALTPDQQQQVAPIERMESSAERWERLCQSAPRQPIPRQVLALLLLTPKKVAYANHAITFTHNKQGYTYIDPEGVLGSLTDGVEFLGYFDPKSPECLYLADLRGAYVGTLIRNGGKRGAIDLRDKDALSQAAGLREKIVNRTLSEIRTRHADKDANIAADRAHNDAILAQHKSETVSLTTAQRIAAAVGEQAALEHTSRIEKAAQTRALECAIAQGGENLTQSDLNAAIHTAEEETLSPEETAALMDALRSPNEEPSP